MSKYNGNDLIIVNGVTMKVSEYKKQCKINKKRAEIQKRNEPYIKALPKYIIKLNKSMKLNKSLVAYQKNGYKQWGTIAKEVMANPFIHEPFMKFVFDNKHMEQTIAKIVQIGKKNDKDIFQYIEKLSYQLMDAKEHLEALSDGIVESNIIDFFSSHECICGSKDGKRLGLRTLLSRSVGAIEQLKNIISELTMIAHEGVDVFEYCAINGKRYAA